MTTIRKSVRSDIADKIPQLVNDALGWMKVKYPEVNFDSVDFIFSAAYNRSRYFRNEKANAKYLSPNACISTRATLMLYEMKSLGIKKNKVFTGSIPQMMCALIHELTHHAQYEQKRSRGELETTANELQYLKENHLNFYNKIMKIKNSHLVS